MKINPQIQDPYIKTSTKDAPTAVVAGDLVVATIKERTGSQEAVVTMKGSEYRVLFEGQMPENNRVQIEILQVKEKEMLVRLLVANGNAGVSATKLTLDQQIAQLGFPQNQQKDLREAAVVLSAKGYPLSKDVLKVISDFLQVQEGNVAQKLDVVKMLARKQLEVTSTNLNSLQAAMGGSSSLAKSIGSLAEEMGVTVKRTATTTPSVPVDALRKPAIGEDGVLNAPTLVEFDAEDSIDIRSSMKIVQREPDMAKVINHLHQLLSHVPDENATHLQNSMDKATLLIEKGREMSARKELLTSLTQIAETMPKQEVTGSALSNQEQAYISQAANSVSSKLVVVTEISEKLSQLALDFKKVRKDLTRNLATITRALEVERAPFSAKQLLETTIKQLDQTILKGDYLLYTDMDTEKKLMQASTRLADARTLLSNGDLPKASELVKDIKQTLEKLVFKPSEVKVQNMVADWSNSPKVDPKEALSQILSSLGERENGARGTFELVKKLGFRNEHQLGHSLVSNDKEAPNNLKSTLLSLLKTDDLPPKMLQQADQLLTQITGQQLLNKQEPGGLQQLAFALPVLFQKDLENVKVFVQSKNQNDKLDWENCSLYFVLETKKLGELGILLNSTNRRLSIEFRSGKGELEEMLIPLEGETRSRLAEIGYQLGAMKVKELTKKTDEARGNVTPKPLEPMKKGYDLTI